MRLHRGLLFSFFSTLTLDLGPWTLDLGPWTLDLGPWTLDLGPWTLDLGPWTLDLGPWTLDLGPWTLDLGPWTLDFGPWTLDLGLGTNPLDSRLYTPASPRPRRRALSPACGSASTFQTLLRGHFRHLAPGPFFQEILGPRPDIRISVQRRARSVHQIISFHCFGLRMVDY